MANHVALLEKPTTELLYDFGAGKASPGSGSAAALMGLLAARLIMTVCLKTLAREDHQKEHRTFDFIKSNISNVIEPKLKELFEKDAQDFEEVVKLRLARNAETDKAKRSIISRQHNDLLETATQNSFEIAEQCLKLIEHGIVAFNNGCSWVRGDSGAAISAGIAGVTSGIFIANLNLKTLKERNFANENIGRCAELYNVLTQKQSRAFECVISLNSEAISAIQLELIKS